MSATVVNDGEFKGIGYNVSVKFGVRSIQLEVSGSRLRIFAAEGAKLNLLDDIGDQDPEKVLDAVFTGSSVELPLRSRYEKETVPETITAESADNTF